jgi:hypothetical protein
MLVETSGMALLRATGLSVFECPSQREDNADKHNGPAIGHAGEKRF